MALAIKDTKAAETPADELAELAARGRKGLDAVHPDLPEGWGEVVTPEERDVTVAAYDANGEAIDVTQAIPYPDLPPDPEFQPAPASVMKITLPGFDAPIDVDIVKLNFTGNIELDIVGEEHRAIWNALRWKGMTTLIVQAKVRDLALQERTGDRAQATLKILSVTRYTDARNPYDDSTEDDDGYPDPEPEETEEQPYNLDAALTDANSDE